MASATDPSLSGHLPRSHRQVFHYGFECFEGMKVYTDAKAYLRLFRHEMNLDRLNRSAVRSALPSLDVAELLKLLAEFVKV